MAFNYYQNPYAQSYGANYATPNYVGNQQQYQPIPQQSPSQANVPMIYGKVVDCLETAKAVDVPIGTSFILPKADGNAVFTKGWNTDGTTYVKEYQLVEPSSLKTDDTPLIDWNEKLDDIYDSIDALSKKIDKMKSTSSSTTAMKKRRQEVDEDDA